MALEQQIFRSLICIVIFFAISSCVIKPMSIYIGHRLHKAAPMQGRLRSPDIEAIAIAPWFMGIQGRACVLITFLWVNHRRGDLHYNRPLDQHACFSNQT